MNLWEKIKNIVEENKDVFIPSSTIIMIISLGVLGKIFFFYKDIFWYVFGIFLMIFFIVVYLLNNNKNFNSFYKEVLVENDILIKKIKKEKKDYFHMDKIIKITSVVVVISFITYFLFIRYDFFGVF